MKVSVKYFGIFKNITEREEETLIIMDGEDIDSLLGRLISRYGEKFHNYIYQEGKKDRLETTFIFVNGKKISTLDHAGIKLQNNDCIMITPMLTGG
jgi:MoaD family protein